LKEASFYITEADGKLKCLLCPKECFISENKTGVCGTRENTDGVLYALTYSKPVAIHLDPIEKKPLYHFHPGEVILSIGTLGCNLDCKFCQNHGISQDFDESSFEGFKEVTPEGIIDICKKNGYKFVAFTYNEPTIFFEYMFDVAVMCKANGIKTVMVSNGQINEEPLLKLIEYMDAFNIDLKSFNPDFYRKICGGEIETTKQTIETIVKHKKHLEVTMLLIKGANDNEEEFEEMCKYLSSLDKNIVLHLSRAFPDYKMEFEVTPIKLINRFYDIAKSHLKNVYKGNI
jgi:pyruvate formate lyase activating enzyme